jgi:hypothetical protein
MSILGEIGFALIGNAKTSFGGLMPDVVTNETATDGAMITDHPVEQGAAITDHVFLRPQVLELQAGYSNSTAGYEDYIVSRYEAMRNLMGRREPFPVFTPRRMYKDMLLQEIRVARDPHTNSVLAFTAVLRQIIITYTQSTSGGAASNASDQANPADTQSSTDQGSRSGSEVSASSALGVYEPPESGSGSGSQPGSEAAASGNLGVYEPPDSGSGSQPPNNGVEIPYIDIENPDGTVDRVPVPPTIGGTPNVTNNGVQVNPAWSTTGGAAFGGT